MEMEDFHHQSLFACHREKLHVFEFFPLFGQI
jgi:hypothetical protein